MRMLSPYWMTKGLTSNLWEDMDRFFDDFSWRTPTQRTYDERIFSCDVTEADDHYLMSMDLPGMKKEDIKIDLKDDTLTISGERKREKRTEKKNLVQYHERFHGAFSRSFALPAAIDTEKTEAHYENGVLEIYLPKTAAAKSRQIEIQSGKSGIFERLLGSSKKNEEARDVTATRIS